MSMTDERRGAGGATGGLLDLPRLAAVSRASSIAEDGRTGLAHFTAMAVRELDVDLAFLSLSPTGTRCSWRCRPATAPSRASGCP